VDRKNFLLGGALVFLGATMFLKNFNINPADTFLLLLGIYFLYLYNINKQQPHLIIGLIATIVSGISILNHVNIFSIDISGGVFFILLGGLFLFLYYNKNIKGFILPGCLLPSVGIYTILINNLNERYAWPSIFLLLGSAFFVIYFTEYMNKENWSLLAGIFLFGMGIICYAVVFGLINIDISKLNNLIWPVALIGVGGIILINNLRIRK